MAKMSQQKSLYIKKILEPIILKPWLQAHLLTTIFSVGGRWRFRGPRTDWEKSKIVLCAHTCGRSKNGWPEKKSLSISTVTILQSPPPHPPVYVLHTYIDRPTNQAASKTGQNTYIHTYIRAPRGMV